MERFPGLDVGDAIVEGGRGGGSRGGHIGVLDVWVVGWWCGVDHGIIRAVDVSVQLIPLGLLTRCASHPS